MPTADMIPSERGLVDLSEGQSSSLIGILDVGEVVVEVVEGGVTTGGLVVVGHGGHGCRQVALEGMLDQAKVQEESRLTSLCSGLCKEKVKTLCPSRQTGATYTFLTWGARYERSRCGGVLPW